MSERAPYSRVYWSIVDDPKFVNIYGDDHHLATWLRLLMAADALWPASCPLPVTARKASITALAEAGLIDLLPFGFKVRGLDAERGRRREAASRPPTKRDPDGSHAGGKGFSHTGPKPSYTETHQAEPDAREDNDPYTDAEGEAVTWLARHGCALPPHSGYYKHVVTMVEAHGINAVIGMFDRLAAAGMKPGDVKGYVFTARDALDSKTRPSLGDVSKAERVDHIAEGFQRRLARTRALIEENSL